MAIINVTFPDGSIKEFSEGTNIGEVAKSISGRLAKEALAALSRSAAGWLKRPWQQR